MKRIEEFYTIVQQQMNESLHQQEEIHQVVELLVKMVKEDGVLHTFGCGHSQMFGYELCFRTGGLFPVNAILYPHYNVWPSAKMSQLMERSEEFSEAVLEMQETTDKDIMLIVSISGRNAAGIEMAMAAKAKGMKVIALTSKTYSSQVTSRHSSGKRLMDVADVVLDLVGVKGDAVLSHEKLDYNFASTSTVVGMTLLIGIIAETIGCLLDEGIETPVWVSGNLPEGDAMNQRYMKKYKGRVSIL